MDGRVIKAIFGVDDLPERELAIASKVYDWCAKHPSRLVSTPPAFLEGGEELRRIDEALIELYGRGLEYFFNTSRIRSMVETRNMVMALYFERARVTKLAMASIFNKNHSTIIYAIKQNATLCQVDRDYKNRYNQLKEQVCKRQLTSCGSCGSSQESC